MRAIASETKGATDCPASSVADFVKNLFVGKFRLRCDKEPSIMAVAEKSESENARLGSGGNLSATQLSEQRPRRTINSDNWRKTLRYDTQNRYKTRITPESAIWPQMVGGYARGAVGFTPFRAAYDRDLSQEIVAFAEPILFKILATEHRGLSSGQRLHKGDTAWEKGIWLGKSQTNPEHMVGTKSGEIEARTIEGWNR